MAGSVRKERERQADGDVCLSLGQEHVEAIDREGLRYPEALALKRDGGRGDDVAG